MLLRKFKRNLMSLHYSLFALIVFVIVYVLEPGECHISVLGNSLNHNRVKKEEQSGYRNSIREVVGNLRSRGLTEPPGVHSIPVEIESSFVPIVRHKDAILSRQKRSPSSERRKSKSDKRSQEPESERRKRKSKNGKRSQQAQEPESARSSAGAIALAMLQMYMNNDKQDDKGKNPLDMYNMQIASFVQDRMKKLRKRVKNAFKKFRECITLFPFSIDRSCLK